MTISAVNAQVALSSAWAGRDLFSNLPKGVIHAIARLSPLGQNVSLEGKYYKIYNNAKLHIYMHVVIQKSSWLKAIADIREVYIKHLMWSNTSNW